MKRVLRKFLRPSVGNVDFGDFRKVRPIGRSFGYERGQPVDRYYIEQFLNLNRGDIYGRVLEVGDSEYTHRFGAENVTAAESLHVSDGRATHVGDLSSASLNIESNSFDCAIVTQTLHLIFSVDTALKNLHRILKPNGVLLLTVPGTTQVGDDEWADSWFWSFTERSLYRLLSEAFPRAHVSVVTYGNVLASVGFLHGLSSTELTQGELDHHDPNYQFLVCARVQKARLGASVAEC